MQSLKDERYRPHAESQSNQKRLALRNTSSEGDESAEDMSATKQEFH